MRIDVWAAGAVLAGMYKRDYRCSGNMVLTKTKINMIKMCTAGLALGDVLWPGHSWQHQLQLIIDTIGALAYSNFAPFATLQTKVYRKIMDSF